MKFPTIRSVALSVSAAAAFVFIAGAALPAHAAGIAFVQVGAADGKASTTVTAAFPSANTAGNLLVACLAWNGTGAFSSMTDTLGNAYIAGTTKTTVSGNNQQCFYAANSKAGTNKVQAKVSVKTTSYLELYVHEYSGAATSSPLEVAKSATGNTTSMTTGAVTTLSANDLIFVHFEDGTVQSAGAGFTSRNTFNSNLTEDQIAATAGSYTATATQRANSAYSGHLMAFKAAAAPVVPPPTPTSTPPTPTSTAPNLILNPTLATANATDGTLPANWNKGGWGTNTITYNYPVAGPNAGDKAAQVTLTNYTNGDAKWYFDPINVQGGAAYTFTDWYNSTSTSVLTAQYSTAGTSAFTYVQLAALPATTGWTSATVNFDAPVNATAITIFHSIQANGSLATTNFSLTLKATAGQNAYPQGIVSLTFDDGWLSQYQNAIPMMNAAGMHGTFYIISNVMNGTLDPTGYMNSTQTLALQNTYGEEVAAHTLDHCDLVKLFNNPNSATIDPANNPTTAGCPDTGPLATPTTAAQEINGSRSAILAAGATPVDTFAYPYGSGAGVPSIEALLAADGFRGAASVNAGYNTKDTDPYALFRMAVDTTATTSTIHQWIDYAAANKVWLILMMHQIETTKAALTGEQEGTTAAVLQDTINYLKSKQTAGTISVQTVHDVLAGTNTPPPTPTPTPPPPTPTSTPTSTLTVNISLNGGTSTVPAFNLTVQNGTTTVFSGAAAASTAFALNVGSSYVVTEATTTASANYNVSLGANCSGVMSTSGAACAIANTFVAPILPTSTPTSTPPTPTSTATNLIVNPAVELATADATTPDHWNRGGWGTNTATLTYPAAGPNGAKAINVTITSYTNGDVKWYFDNVPVTAGATYTFSDSYNSNIASTLTAQFATASGALSYVDIGSLASTGGAWATSTAQFTVPANVTAVTIFHLINKVGSLTTTNASLIKN